jgi:hypothetical protein
MYAAMEFSRCARDASRPTEKPARGPVSQNSTARNAEVNVVLGEPEDRTKLPKERHRDSSGAYRSKSSDIPRKEVIQPQLPLRLPCYDFTPIIDPTFDGCLPCGLAHRLRVLPTFVV